MLYGDGGAAHGEVELWKRLEAGSIMKIRKADVLKKKCPKTEKDAEIRRISEYVLNSGSFQVSQEDTSCKEGIKSRKGGLKVAQFAKISERLLKSCKKNLKVCKLMHGVATLLQN